MKEKKGQQCAGGCVESPVWAALDELGLDYERSEI